MGSGLVINGLSTGGEVHKLQAGVTLEKAYQKGLKDGLDQVYFSAKNENYVLQGDNLKLGEVRETMKNNTPAVVLLDNEPVQIHLQKIDDEVSSIGDGFVKNNPIASGSLTAIGVGLPVALFSGLGSIVTMNTGSAVAKAVTTGGIYLGLAAAAVGTAGLLYYTGKSVYQGATNKPNPDQSKEIKLQDVIDTRNNAKEAGHYSVIEKQQTAQNIATDLLIDSLLDVVFD